MLLFLDIDGVLHPEHIPGLTPGKFRVNSEHFSCLPYLEDVLREFQGIQVVISSAWRTRRSLDELRDIFSPELRSRVIGVTPQLPRSEGHRQREIENWLIEHDRGHEDWIAIDDWPPLFDQVCPMVFFTETLIGLDKEAAEKLRYWIKARYDCSSN